MKSLNSKLRILAGIILFCPVAMAGEYLKTEYSYRRYTTQDGLPHMQCTSLFQDSRGFIWIGTSSGFVRYDGFTFKGFDAQRSDGIRKFFEDKNGTVTAIGASHIYRVFPDNSSQRIRVPGIQFNIYTSTMLPFPYFVCSDGRAQGIYKMVDTCIVKLFNHPALTDNDYNTNFPFLDTVDSLFYISGKRSGTYAVSPSGHEVQQYKTPNLKSFFRFGSSFYAFGDSGIYVKDEKRFRLVHQHFFVPTIKVIERDGKMIIKDIYGLYAYDGKKWDAIYQPASKDIHFDFLFDSEDNLWFGTERGLYNLFRLQFQSYKLTKESDQIVAMVEDDQRRIWMGTRHGDLLRMSGKDTVKISLGSSIYGNSYSGGAININGKLYLCFNQTIQEIDHGSVGLIKKMNLRDDEKTYLPGNLYAVGDTLVAWNLQGNLYAIKDRRIVKFWSAATLKLTKAQTFNIDKKGHWIACGAPAGLSVIYGDSGRLITNKNLENVRTTTRDGYGMIWIGAEDRICTWNGDSVKLITELTNHRIISLKCVKQHFLLVGTVNGIFLYDLRDYYGKNEFKAYYYNRLNGYTGLDPQRKGIFEDSSGRVWIMSSTEATCFRPEELIRSTPAPQLNILSRKFSKDNIHWEEMPGEQERLGYRQKNIRFSFIGLCFSAADHVRYQYCLKGFQDEWSQPVAESEVTFNNLPPGRYEFQLKANSGVPGTETPVVSQSFMILPAFWQTWWFYVICVVALFFTVLWIAYRYINKKNAEKIHALERQKQLNSLQIQSIRLRSIPHFNANVLAGIEYYIMNFSREEANHYLAMYSSFTNLTLRDVDRPARSLAEEIRYVELYLGLEKMRYGDQFEFSIDISPEVDRDVLLPNMILHTHCENALKHGLRAKKGKGHIRIAADPLIEDEVLVAIEDDGIGRTEAERLQTGGTGQGLAILSQQIVLYNQTNDAKLVQRIIDLTDSQALACGTRVEIEVPKGFRYS